VSRELGYLVVQSFAKAGSRFNLAEAKVLRIFEKPKSSVHEWTVVFLQMDSTNVLYWKIVEFSLKIALFYLAP
jgi:hypothetical protein